MFRRAMGTILQTSCERVHITLSVALLAACVTNVVLVCAWLSSKARSPQPPAAKLSLRTAQPVTRPSISEKTT